MGDSMRHTHPHTILHFTQVDAGDLNNWCQPYGCICRDQTSTTRTHEPITHLHGTCSTRRHNDDCFAQMKHVPKMLLFFDIHIILILRIPLAEWNVISERVLPRLHLYDLNALPRAAHWGMSNNEKFLWRLMAHPSCIAWRFHTHTIPQRRRERWTLHNDETRKISFQVN